MSRAKQSAFDRAKRLSNRCCPVHGLGMSQASTALADDDGREYVLVDCPRRDCSILVKAYSPDGPFELLPEWAHLIELQPQQ